MQHIDYRCWRTTILTVLKLISLIVTDKAAYVVEVKTKAVD
ncbi:MAG: hypothetical protein QXH10_00390 [Ignisphaera sp.]